MQNKKKKLKKNKNNKGKKRKKKPYIAKIVNEASKVLFRCPKVFSFALVLCFQRVACNKEN